MFKVFVLRLPNSHKRIELEKTYLTTKVYIKAMISNKKLFHNNLLIVLMVMCSIINVRASELLSPPCSISLTATPSACSGATNSFSVSGNISFSDAPTTGILSVSAGGVTQTFYAPFTSSQAYTLNGLTADGAVHSITATFSDASTCSSTINFTAPISCCSATNYSLCAGESYTLIAQVGLTNITWHKIVGTDTLQITAANGQQNYIATEVGKYIFKGTDANGCPAKLCCPIEIVAGTNCPVFDLALKKVLATGQSANVAIGSNVTFTINVINQGGIAATNVQLTDYIPAGLTLNDANWTAVGNKATLVTPIAALGTGQNTNVNIIFSVNAGTSGTITNYAEISAASNAVNLNDIDSTPDANDTNDGTPQNDVVAGDHKNNPAQDEDDHDLEPICVIPSATASALDGTCSGPNYNNDGTITLANFLVAERYAYTTGNSYTGSATYTTATAIPANGIIANNLPNPTGTQSYTIRIFNSSDCYIDRTVTINKAICDCPVVAAPVIADKSRCGTGTLTTTITTACAAGSALKIFSDVALTTDVTSSFTVAGNNLTSSSLSATTTYYAACVNTTYPVCISLGDAFVLTVNPIPTATAIGTDGTCSGPNYNNDGTITLANFLVAERYAYTTGNSYTGIATYTTATAIPANGIIANNLPNPTGTQSYTIRIFNSSDCYIDRTVTINEVTCKCPDVAAPIIADKSRCGTGTLTTTITTACAAGSALKIFSDVALTTDVTSSFTVVGNNLTSSSLSATATYYAACVNTTYPVCISLGDAFVLTINPIPTATAIGTDGTCSGPYYNNDGTITLANFLVAERYAYTTGNSYTGIATYTTATAIPANGIIANNLPNPTGTQSYTIRIFNSSDCYIDRTVTINEVTCKCPDVAAPIIADSHRCGNGTVLATISKGCSAGSSLKIYSDALLSTDITSQFTLGSTSITSPTLSATTTYYAACVHDTYPICISLSDAFVLTVIPQPIAGADVAMCLPKTTYNFEDAAVGYEWVTVSGNPAAAYINPRDGMVNNMIQVGTYRFRLRSTFDITCFDEVIITVSQGEAPIVLCDDGTGGHIARAPLNLSNVIWYSMSGQQVGTGNAFVITSKTPGLEDGAEAYYYVGVDGTATGCDVELCCPVRISTRYCCPVPNCFGVTVIKK